MIKNFCKVAVTEGWSYLLLLFIAMPIKYFFHNEIPVKIIGWAHGVLFMVYMAMLLNIWIKLKWPFNKVFWAGIAAFIPFATFMFEKQLKREYAL